MRFMVTLDGIPIGYSDLDSTDPSMGMAFGAFMPTDAYYQVQHVFLLFAVGKYSEYYSMRDTLNLELLTSFQRIVPTDCIHIVDFSQIIGDGNMELEVRLADVSAWQEFDLGDAND